MVHDLLVLSVDLVMLVVQSQVQIGKAAFVVTVLDEMVDSYLKVEFSHVLQCHVVILCNMGT